LFFFAILASIFGGVLRILGPAALILIGILIMLNAVNRRAKGGMPQE
jgi:hypothetical protein